MTYDLDRATNLPLQTAGPSFKICVRRVLRGTCAMLAVAAMFVAPLRAQAGELDAPPPTLLDVSAPAADAQPAQPVQPAQSVQPAQPAQTSAPVMPAGASAPAPRVDNGLSLTGRVLWDGLQDQRVSLKLKNGVELHGRVVTQSTNDLAFARGSDGAVVAVPKAEIAGVRLRSQAGADTSFDNGAGPVDIRNRPIDSGRRLHAGGVALLSFGVPFGLAGTVMLGLCPSCLYIHLPLLLPGIGLIIGGAVAIKRSKQRNKAFREAWGIPLAGRMQLTPSLAFTRGGGEVGFALRF